METKIVPLSKQIQFKIADNKNKTKSLSLLSKDVDLLLTTATLHHNTGNNIKLQNETEWLPSLETALTKALDTIKVMISKPFQAKLKASQHNQKIKDARENIRIALQHMSFINSSHIFPQAINDKNDKNDKNDADAADKKYDNKSNFSALRTVMAISKSYIVIGNPDKDNNRGELYIYNIEGFYIRSIRAHDGKEEDCFARSVSLHNDLIVVGAPFRTCGKAYVYNVASGDLVAELVPPDSIDDDGFGFSVGISQSHIVIGAPWNRKGKVYIYNYSNNNWNKNNNLNKNKNNNWKPSAEIVPNDLGDMDSRGGDMFSYNVSLSGNFIVLGAAGQDKQRGAAYLYNVKGQQLAKLTAKDGQPWDCFGDSVSVSVSKDKNSLATVAAAAGVGVVVVVGAYLADEKKGATYIFDKSGNQIHKLMDPNGQEQDGFGCHVSSDNHYIAVRTLHHVLIYDNQTGKLLVRREAPGENNGGDVKLLDEKLVVHDTKNNAVILMQHPS